MSKSAQRYCVFLTKNEKFYKLSFSIRLFCVQIRRIILIFGGIFGGILGGNNPPKNLQVDFQLLLNGIILYFTWDNLTKKKKNLLYEIIKKFLKYWVFSKISKNIFFLWNGLTPFFFSLLCEKKIFYHPPKIQKTPLF